MKFFYWLFALILVVFTIDFVMTNSTVLSFGSWFLPWQADLPVGLVVLLALAIGLFIGGLISWASGAGARRRARLAERRAEKLQQEFDAIARRTDEAEREAAAYALPRPDAGAAAGGGDSGDATATGRG
jgi:uncharacterized integral membrane protein